MLFAEVILAIMSSATTRVLVCRELMQLEDVLQRMGSVPRCAAEVVIRSMVCCRTRDQLVGVWQK